TAGNPYRYVDRTVARVATVPDRGQGGPRDGKPWRLAGERPLLDAAGCRRDRKRWRAGRTVPAAAIRRWPAGTRPGGVCGGPTGRLARLAPAGGRCRRRRLCEGKREPTAGAGAPAADRRRA